MTVLNIDAAGAVMAERRATVSFLRERAGRVEAVGGALGPAWKAALEDAADDLERAEHRRSKKTLAVEVGESSGFGEIIRQRLDELGWTKSDLARRLQVSAPRIHNLLAQGNITEQVAIKVFTVLGMRMEVVSVSRPKPPKVTPKVGGMKV